MTLSRYVDAVISPACDMLLLLNLLINSLALSFPNPVDVPTWILTFFKFVSQQLLILILNLMLFWLMFLFIHHLSGALSLSLLWSPQQLAIKLRWVLVLCIKTLLNINWGNFVLFYLFIFIFNTSKLHIYILFINIHKWYKN